MKQEDVMIDLETMGLSSNPAIWAIGAVSFDFETGVICEKFYKVIDLQSAVTCGGQMDASTVMWWMKQSAEARAEMNQPGEHIVDVLVHLKHWLREVATDDVKVWGDGAAEDNVWLANAYKNCAMPVPWSYRGNRCYRTVRGQFPSVPWAAAAPTIAHHALHDAEAQARHLLLINRMAKEGGVTWTA